jgi:microcystin-dependent protein
MAVNYNRTKSLKGLAVGTIVPWSGSLSGPSGIPKGWLACNGSGYPVDRYPELFEIIGYRYTAGASETSPTITFNLPNLPGKSLGDYHPSHATDCGYTGNFASSLPTTSDSPAEVTGVQSSNVDLKVSLNLVSNLRANMTGMNLSSPSYSTTFSYVPRRLGDAHFGTHGHNTVELPSISVTDSEIEECQDTGGIGFVPDTCTEQEIYKCSNVNTGDDDFCRPAWDGGRHVGRGQNPYGTNAGEMQRVDTPGSKNYIRKSDDCVLYNERSADLIDIDPDVNVGDDAPWAGIYGTTLMTDNVNFQVPNMTGHDHVTQSLSIESSGVFTKETVRINTISSGNIAPVDADTAEVLSITANVNTPSIQMLFIIKAY